MLPNTTNFSIRSYKGFESLAVLLPLQIRITRDARLEAQRDGAPPLDLIDGDELILMLKDMQSGVHVRQKISEEITVDTNWFATF